ncbi:MAG: ethylbenzene dehydrogenase-related protein [Syntrophobacteraceae bacterium]
MKAQTAGRLRFVLGVVFSVILMGHGHLGASEPTVVVTAKHLRTAPTGLDDPVWQQMHPIEAQVKGRGSFAEEEVTVITRAAYTAESIYFLFKWVDPTESVAKESWRFDGRNWTHVKGDEDRIALLFEITRINGFATRGCTVVCHSPPDVPGKEWRYATKTAAEKGDLWHWKAARSNPYHHADDSWLTVAGNPSGSYRTTGRRADAGGGGDAANETEDKAKPFYMQDPSRKPSVPGFLLFEEAIRIPADAVFKTGDMITYRMLRKPNGSRSDVKAIGKYADGGWTVMLSRKLETGHEDDVAFNPRKEYSFAMAVFDDSGDDHSKATHPMILRFER